VLKKNNLFLILLIVVGFLVFVYTLPHFLKLVEILGKRIPQKNIRLDYVIGVAWAAFLGVTIYFWPVPSAHKKALGYIWMVKCFVMLGLMLFYEHHYQVDSYGYFNAATHHIREWRRMEVLGPSNPVILLIQVLRNSFLDSFHAIKASFGMIGLFACYVFYLAAAEFLRRDIVRLLYVFALFPSILFWSSVIGKEPILLIAIAVYSYGVVKLIRTESFSSSVFIILGLITSVYIRLWLGIILGLPVLLMVVRMMCLNRNSFKKIGYVLVFVSSIIILVFSTHGVTKIFYLKSFKDLSIFANKRFTTFSIGGSLLEAKPDGKMFKKADSGDNALARDPKDPVGENKPAYETAIDENSGVTVKIKYRGLKDLALFVPRGVFTVLFRPLPGEVKNIFGLMAGLEDTVLLILFIIAVFKVRWRELFTPFFIWAISLIVVWSIAYGFVGYNLGTVCRYRMQILPIFLGIILYFVFEKKGLGKPEIKE
jgi:hypothetical protein